MADNVKVPAEKEVPVVAAAPVSDPDKDKITELTEQVNELTVALSKLDATNVQLISDLAVAQDFKAQVAVTGDCVYLGGKKYGILRSDTCEQMIHQIRLKFVPHDNLCVVLDG